ncbi:MAG: deoxyribose-phosphate aldolase [Candidatus Kapaibacteriota bacterium]|jgi:deoxyribose-phosphate aldolase
MQLAPYIDHTLLKPDSTEQQMITLCTEAAEHGFASVCILPWHVATAAQVLAEMLTESLTEPTVPVCTVVGFPLGASTTHVKVAETARAIADGATEIDMVISITALKSGHYQQVLDDVRAVTEAAHGENALVKVIIESCLLTHDEKVRMCEIVSTAGADFIKTSTGFSTGGATLDDVALLRRHVANHVKVKASGGIRDRQTALDMIAAGAERLGTSSGVAIVAG